ncbi:MAG: TerB family tellurite resistance protein [Proteobacteria bacterium]|nr:TerB family tellurite resistance protein [Pseudomonadota bacterium]
MLDRLFALIADITDEPREPFQEGDYRVAAAALLVHVMSADGVAAPVERQRLEAVLSAGFDLSVADTRRLVVFATDAEAAEDNWTSFAQTLASHLDEDGRRRVVEMMWAVVLADGRAHELEEAVVERAAELLGVEMPAR